jgi:hypothetical protein
MMLHNYVYKLSISFSNYALLKTSFHNKSVIIVGECHVMSVYSQLRGILCTFSSQY